MKYWLVLLVCSMVMILQLNSAQSFGTVRGKVCEDRENFVIPGVIIQVLDTEFHTIFFRYRQETGC